MPVIVVPYLRDPLDCDLEERDMTPLELCLLHQARRLNRDRRFPLATADWAAFLEEELEESERTLDLIGKGGSK